MIAGLRFGIGLTACLLLTAGWSTPALAARAMKPLEIKQTYAQVLGVLASGDLDRALTELVALEQKAVGDQQVWRYVDNLWRLKLGVIRDLATDHPLELLMPIIVLHHDAYFRYKELGKRYLAQHSRTMAAELADLYADRAGTGAAGAFAGWTLTSFATYLWSPTNIRSSADLFYRTHLLDPGNSLALRGLAVAYERNGEYEKAMEYLQRALVLEPKDPELLLRLALCHLRNEREIPQRTLALLSSLTDPGDPQWVRSVAYQELARARLTLGDSAGAEALLREGLAAIPGDQQLSLQLASILDGQRRRSEAIATLDAIQINGWEKDSPRQMYDFWGPPDMDAVRAALREEMQGGLVALSASLASGPSGSAGS